jgi:hypothetical protein
MITPQNEDDDANSATNPNKPSAADVDGWSKGLSKAAKAGTEALKAAWVALPEEARPMLEALKDALKGQAERADAGQATQLARKPADAPTGEPVES